MVELPRFEQITYLIESQGHFYPYRLFKVCTCRATKRQVILYCFVMIVWVIMPCDLVGVGYAVVQLVEALR